jgi:ArsR family transcriptional regulator, arsenate/arsenite/antimonite-responsive transcriptional repressor / arsenate reductase (thioredoxin)
MPRSPADNDQERISAVEAAAVFAALSQETRLEVYRLLVRYQPFGLAAGDIARLVAVPHNTLSTHLATLQNAGLVRSRREGRSIIFAAAPSRFAAAHAFLAQGLAVVSKAKPASPALASYPIRRPEENMSDKVYNVLVLCTGNSARSILAEAILNREGKGRFQAFSAGSQPKGHPNPVGINFLTSLGYDTNGFRSKSWTEFAEAGAPKMDIIITVCDSAAGEACPYWPGHPLVAHWGIPDPADVEGTPDQERAAFQEAYRRLMSRVTALVNLPLDKLPLNELKARLAEIGTMDGATKLARSGVAA